MFVFGLAGIGLGYAVDCFGDALDIGAVPDDGLVRDPLPVIDHGTAWVIGSRDQVVIADEIKRNGPSCPADIGVVHRVPQRAQAIVSQGDQTDLGFFDHEIDVILLLEFFQLIDQDIEDRNLSWISGVDRVEKLFICFINVIHFHETIFVESVGQKTIAPQYDGSDFFTDLGH